jgi:hypothetical protein
MQRCFVKSLVIILAAVVFIAGCQWEPDRDNTVDPKSSFYIVPPEPNHPPRISDLSALTDSRKTFVGDDIYTFEVRCRISDSDLNLIPDSILAFASNRTIPLGRMTFNPEKERFYLLCTPDRFPELNIRELFSSNIMVLAADSDGARDSAFAYFNPLVDLWPTIRYPVADTLDTLHPRLGWNEWHNSQVDSFTYSLSIWKMNLYSVWETTGLLETDTALTVPYDGLQDANSAPHVFYSWYLTVEDTFGNRITGIPGNFWIILRE